MQPVRQDISRHAVHHGSEGWTTLRSTKAPTPYVSHASAFTEACTAGSECCLRHPRAQSCRRAMHLAVAPAVDRSNKAAGGAPPTTLYSPTGLVLRDDLYLEEQHSKLRPSNLSVSAAPAVVRAYEACEPDSRAFLRHERNATEVSRRALAAEPLPIVAIIFFGTHTERLPAMRTAYAPYFRSLVFMTLTARAGPRAAADARIGGHHHHYHCRAGLKATYACVAHVADTHGAATGIRGVLYFHFDLWLRPWSLLQVASWPSEPLDSLWALPPGRIMIKASGPTRLLPFECFNASRPQEYERLFRTAQARGDGVPAWTWARDLPPARAALRRACTPAGGGAPTCDPTRVCVGWADLYYIPRHAFAPFGELARSFARGPANAELAVPTMVRILGERSAPSAAPPVLRAPCWGFCCSSTPCPELLARHVCGHRMRLDVPRMRQTFERLWKV